MRRRLLHAVRKRLPVGSRTYARASSYNWIGFQLASLARTVHGLDRVSLYGSAAAQFAQAATVAPRWYLPVENLADITSYLGEFRRDASQQRQAVRLYTDAIELASDRAGYAGRPYSERIREENLAQLQLSRAIAQLLLEVGREPADQDALFAPLGPAWVPARESGPVILYTAGCYFARGYERFPFLVWLRLRAIQCLAYAFVLRSDLAEQAQGDPDLFVIAEEVRLLSEALSGADADPETAHARAERAVAFFASEQFPPRGGFSTF